MASSADKTFSYIPDCSDLDIPEDADYVYICENNTIYGTKYKTLPNTKGHTLVADVSSCFLSEPVDVTKYGVRRTLVLPALLLLSSEKILSLTTFSRAHLQCSSGKLRLTQILFITHLLAMESISAARYSSG